MTDIYRLAAILARSNRSNNLRHNSAGYLEASRAFNHFAVHNGAVVQHIANVNQAAVKNRLDKIICVMEMQNALLMCLGNLLRQHQALRQILRNLTGNQVALRSSHRSIFIGVFLHNVFIIIADQGKDGLISRIRLTHQRTLIAIDDILLRQLKLALFHQAMLNHILNILNKQAHAVASLYISSDFFNLLLLDTIFGLNCNIGFMDCFYNFVRIKVNCSAIALNNFHSSSTSFPNILSLITKDSYTYRKALTIQVKAFCICLSLSQNCCIIFDAHSLYHNISCVSKEKFTICSFLAFVDVLTADVALIFF